MRKSLTKREIIRKKLEIDRIFKLGARYSSSRMRLYSLENSLGYDRLIVIPKRHFGRAVDRNLARRRAKEIFRNYDKRHQEGSEFYPKAKDYVLVVYPGRVSDFASLESDLIKLLDKSNQK